MKIVYTAEKQINPQQFIDVLVRSTLAERRPVSDPRAVVAMLAHANLMITAWQGSDLIGVARSLTDFEYCCYLSDLAVDRDFQRRGIGAGLLRATRKALGPGCTIILLAAPAAVDYYPHLGFERHPSAWVLPPGKTISRTQT